MNFQNHLVTVLIITFNRAKDLEITLTKLLHQDYKNLEIIVVDNASTDNTISVISELFPEIILIKSSANIGVAAFNLGLKQANGKFILILDDDSYPLEGTIMSGVKTLTSENNIAIVAYNIYNSKFSFYQTEYLTIDYPTYFIGAGVLVRKSVINKIGFYDDLYYIYNNEIDLSIRILNAGYQIKYLPGNIVNHFSAGVQNCCNKSILYTSKFRFYHMTLGQLIFLLKHFSWQWVVIYSTKWLINRLIVAVKYGYTHTLLKSFGRYLLMIPSILRKRCVVRNEIQELYNYGKVPLVDREFFPYFIKPKLFRQTK